MAEVKGNAQVCSPALIWVRRGLAVAPIKCLLERPVPVAGRSATIERLAEPSPDVESDQGDKQHPEAGNRDFPTASSDYKSPIVKECSISHRNCLFCLDRRYLGRRHSPARLLICNSHYTSVKGRFCDFSARLRAIRNSVQIQCAGWSQVRKTLILFADFNDPFDVPSSKSQRWPHPKCQRL